MLNFNLSFPTHVISIQHLKLKDITVNCAHKRWLKKILSLKGMLHVLVSCYTNTFALLKKNKKYKGVVFFFFAGVDISIH